MKHQQSRQLRWYDAFPTGFLVAYLTIWFFDWAPDPKWALTTTGWIVSATFGLACGAIAYLWKRSRQTKP